MKNNRIIQAVADLFPGYFAIVMATGIISTATFLLGMKWLAWPLLTMDFLIFIPSLFIYVALAAWLITFMSLIHSLLRRRT